MEKDIKKFKSNYAQWIELNTKVVYQRGEDCLSAVFPLKRINFLPSEEKIEVFMEFKDNKVYLSDLGKTISRRYISLETQKKIQTYLNFICRGTLLDEGYILGVVSSDNFVPFLQSYLQALTAVELFVALAW